MSGNILEMVSELAKQAREASRVMAYAAPAAKNAALQSVADLLRSGEAAILEANKADCAAAVKAGLDAPKLDRLRLTPAVIKEMAEAAEYVKSLPDPVGAMDSQWQQPNGLLVGRMRAPLGVIAMIYESRPNVTVDAAILCLKAGNAVILRGGSEAFHSNMALAQILRQALERSGLPASAVRYVPVREREAVNAMCELDEYIDVIIPRGGEGLIKTVSKLARMPVLKHDKGVCHCYVDNGADLPQAAEIVLNAKAQRPGVCNALEGLLVHRDEAAAFLPMAAEKLGRAGVSFRACPQSLPILEKAGAKVQAARPDDYGQEFHDLILAVKVVSDPEEAKEHIAAYGSRHSEVICTRDHQRAMRFVREVDASLVAVNASSRFNDGGQLGLGAEIGISTCKLHAYGPMGVRELTTTRFVVFGSGQVRE